MAMNYLLLIVVISLLVIIVWLAWRYRQLKNQLVEYSRSIRKNETHNISPNAKELDDLSSAVSSLISTFDLKNSALDSERARLATVLDQLTDGVLIADSHGLIQFANPAAGKLRSEERRVGKECRSRWSADH